MSLKFDAIRVRAHVRNGEATGKWFVDIPASLTSTGKRKRRLYGNRRQAEAIARELSRKLKLKALGYVDKTTRSGLLLRDGVELWKEAQRMRVETHKLRSSSLKINGFRLAPVVAFFGTYDIAWSAIKQSAWRTAVHQQRSIAKCRHCSRCLSGLLTETTAALSRPYKE
jgi:hypothetical protein